MNTEDGTGAGAGGAVATPPAAQPQEPKPVFDPAQQKKLDEIIDKTVGRLKGDFEAKEAEYKRQIEELKAKATKPPTIDPKELTEKYVPKEDFMKLSEDLKRTQDEITSTYTDIAKARIKAAMERVLEGKRPDVVEDYIDIVMKAVTIENRDFKIIDNGKQRVNQNGDPMSIEEFTVDFLSKRPSLLPAGVAGSGTSKGSGKGANSKELTRAEWDQLNPKEKADFFKNGGKLK